MRISAERDLADPSDPLWLARQIAKRRGELVLFVVDGERSNVVYDHEKELCKASFVSL